jgi:hypothetical protein
MEWNGVTTITGRILKDLEAQQCAMVVMETGWVYQWYKNMQEYGKIMMDKVSSQNLVRSTCDVVDMETQLTRTLITVFILLDK